MPLINSESPQILIPSNSEGVQNLRGKPSNFEGLDPQNLRPQKPKDYESLPERWKEIIDDLTSLQKSKRMRNYLIESIEARDSDILYLTILPDIPIVMNWLPLIERTAKKLDIAIKIDTADPDGHIRTAIDHEN
jgi:hypothetical protein